MLMTTQQALKRGRVLAIKTLCLCASQRTTQIYVQGKWVLKVLKGTQRHSEAVTPDYDLKEVRKGEIGHLRRQLQLE